MIWRVACIIMNRAKMRACMYGNVGEVAIVFLLLYDECPRHRCFCPVQMLPCMILVGVLAISLFRDRHQSNYNSRQKKEKNKKGYVNGFIFENSKFVIQLSVCQALLFLISFRQTDPLFLMSARQILSFATKINLGEPCT